MRTMTLMTSMVALSASGLLGCSDGEMLESDSLSGFSASAGSLGGETGAEGGDAATGGDQTGSGDGDGDPSGSGDGDGDGSGSGDGDGDADTGPNTSGSGDGDGEPGGTGDAVPCDIPAISSSPVVPHVVLVLDKSGSMIQNSWDHDANPQTPKITRWHSLHNVVSLIVENFDGQFEFGAQLYPSANATNDYNANACLVSGSPEVSVGPDNAVDILLGIPTGTSQNIRGGTPTAAGVSSAIDHLLAVDDGDPAAIILVTDGAANCRGDAVTQFERFETYDPNLLGIVGDAFTGLEIPTYVVGIDIDDAVTGITGKNGQPPDGEPDGISPYDQLNGLAVAGGKPLGDAAKFYQTQNELELQAAIQAIVEDAASCEINLDPPPPFPDMVEIIVDGEMVAQVDDCAGEDGWVYVDGSYTSVMLCGSYCEQAAMWNEIVAEYYCDPG